MVSVRRTRIRQLAEAGSRPARLALDLIESPDRLLSATQLGVTPRQPRFGLGCGEHALRPLSRPLLALLPVVPTAGAVHVLSFGVRLLPHHVPSTWCWGRSSPKHLALARAESLALAIAPPVAALRPAPSRFFVTLVQRSAAAVSRLVGLHAPGGQGRPTPPTSSSTFFAAIALPGRAGRQQREMLRRAIDFYDLTAREVMVPRKDLVSLSDAASLDQVLDCLVRTRHTPPAHLRRLARELGGRPACQGLLGLHPAGAALAAARPARPAVPYEIVHARAGVRAGDEKSSSNCSGSFQQRRQQMAAVVGRIRHCGGRG